MCSKFCIGHFCFEIVSGQMFDFHKLGTIVCWCVALSSCVSFRSQLVRFVSPSAGTCFWLAALSWYVLLARRSQLVRFVSLSAGTFRAVLSWYMLVASCSQLVRSSGAPLSAGTFRVALRRCVSCRPQLVHACGLLKSAGAFFWRVALS